MWKLCNIQISVSINKVLLKHICLCTVYHNSGITRTKMNNWDGDLVTQKSPNIYYFYLCCWNKLGSSHWHTVKPFYWHHVVRKKTAVFTARHARQRVRAAWMLKHLNSPMGFRKAIFKARWGRGVQSMWSAGAQLSAWLMVRSQGCVTGFKIISPGGLGALCSWSPRS